MDELDEREEVLKYLYEQEMRDIQRFSEYAKEKTEEIRNEQIKKNDSLTS